MFNDVLKEVTGIFDRRFLLNAFFPCLIFWGLLGVIGIVGSGWDPLKILQTWNQQDGVLKTLEIIGFIAIVVFSATVVTSQAGNILRFYEGYWKFPLSQKLFGIGKAWHQQQLQDLDVKSRMQKYAQQMQSLGAELSTSQDVNRQQLLQRKQERFKADIQKLQKSQFALQEKNYREYPPIHELDQVMPTRVGNVLKSAERYPNTRYNIDAVLIWSRLYHSFPDRFVQIITEARTTLDFALAISALSGLFSLISGIWLIVMKAPGWLFLLCFWGGALVAWLAYRSAIGSAAAYAEQVRAAFDLYRHELVKQLHLKPAQTPDEEIKQWREIRELFYGGKASSTWTYLDVETQKKDSQNGGSE